jgi:hypothetical protein
MAARLNAHRLLRGTTTSNGYLQKLDVDDAKERQLRRARDLIRATIRQELEALAGVAVQKGLIDRRDADKAAGLTFRPRFRMQGSAVYHTLNDPAYRPTQQIDYDDGMFLPTSFVNGSATPIIAAKGLFVAVEGILLPLCARQGWSLIKDKKSCVRVEIAADAHIDLALYAIPDDEFTRLVEAARVQVRKDAGPVAQEDEAELAKGVYESLPSDRIMLAQRNGKWTESDPRKMERWFQDAVDEHDEGLRYVCRYNKGWRDFQWPRCGLSSIAVMACVVAVYDDMKGTLPDDRDDTALLAVAERLPGLLEGRIENPVIAGQYLDEDWTPEERAGLVNRARKMHADLDAALNRTLNKSLAIEGMQKVFGPRIPDDETLLSIDAAEREVQSYKPAAVAAPTVRRTTSG